MSERFDAVIVGGGIIGLSIAWRARTRGLSVALIERGRVGEGASGVAAGMLAPVAEADYGEAAQRLLELGLRSAAMWPAFAEELLATGGVDPELRGGGTLLLARDDDEARELERQLDLRRSLELPVERLRGSAARELEPALAAGIRLALLAPEDHSVDPRRALEALAAACRRTGVRVLERAGAARVALSSDGRRAIGADLPGGERVRGETVVLAAGAMGEGLGLPAAALVPVRPVKGQIMRLRDPEGPGLLERVVRFDGGYLVPRRDGRYVLGATMEESGLDVGATVGGVYGLLRDARELVPGVLELELEELAAGLRPATPDNLPALGPGALEGLAWAAGHHRGGVLLAPLTAELLAALLAGEAGSRESIERTGAGAQRFAASGSRPGVREVAA